MFDLFKFKNKETKKTEVHSISESDMSWFVMCLRNLNERNPLLFYSDLINSDISYLKGVIDTMPNPTEATAALTRLEDVSRLIHHQFTYSIRTEEE